MKYQIHARWYEWAESLEPPQPGCLVLEGRETRQPVELPEALDAIQGFRAADLESGLGLADYWIQPV